jgi:hypothetical protein
VLHTADRCAELLGKCVVLHTADSCAELLGRCVVLHRADICAELLGTAIFYRPVYTSPNTLDYTGMPTFLPQNIPIHCILKRFTNSKV